MTISGCGGLQILFLNSGEEGDLSGPAGICGDLSGPAGICGDLQGSAGICMDLSSFTLWDTLQSGCGARRLPPSYSH